MQKMDAMGTDKVCRRDDMLTRRDLFQNTLKAISAIAGWEVGKRLFGGNVKAEIDTSTTTWSVNSCDIRTTPSPFDGWTVVDCDINGTTSKWFVYYNDGRIEWINSFGEQK